MEILAKQNKRWGKPLHKLELLHLVLSHWPKTLRVIFSLGISSPNWNKKCNYLNWAEKIVGVGGDRGIVKNKNPPPSIVILSPFSSLSDREISSCVQPVKSGKKGREMRDRETCTHLQTHTGNTQGLHPTAILLLYVLYMCRNLFLLFKEGIRLRAQNRRTNKA